SSTCTWLLRFRFVRHFRRAVRIELLRRLKKTLRVLAQFFVYLRMRFQIIVQRRMILEVLLVAGERRILGKFASDVAVPFHELVEAGEFAATHIPVATRVKVFAAVKALLLMHEGIRILLVLLAKFRMIGQELLQIRVALHKLLVVYQRWIFAQLLRNLRMAIHKMVHVRQRSAGHVAITTLVFAAVKALLLMHEGIRILAEFFADFRMLLQVLLQLAVLLNKLFVVHQRRIPPHLFGDLWVAVEKAVKAGKLSPGCVIPVG